MAWTLHLLIGITVIAASAYKCKHTAYSTDDDSRYGYDFKRDAGYPQPMSRLQMNPQADVVVQNDRDVVEERAQLRIEPSNRRSDEVSKVLSRKQMDSRRGNRDPARDGSKIVFPGLTSNAAPLEIPARCKKLGICDEVGNYPQEEVNQIIARLDDISTFQNDKLDLPDVPDITQRLGPPEENIELCSFNKTVIYPRAGMDSSGKWHFVLNTDENPLQGYKVEICQTDSGNCSDIAIIQSGYEARCVQKYVYRKMAILHEGQKLEMPLKVPSCCSCVAKFVIR